MKYNRIPNTDLNVSMISLGTWVFGGDMWGGSSEKECIDVVHKCADFGVNLIDTAAIYGFGRSEEIVGKAIRGMRDKFVIATKCGLKKEGNDIVKDLSPKFLREEIDNSLKRLAIECVDIYQCHWPDESTPIEDTLQELAKIKKEGKIRHIGVSNFGLELLKKASDFMNIATLQNHYSLLERSLENGLMEFCKDRGIAILSYGSLGGGILSGKYKSTQKFDKSDARSFFYKFYDKKNFLLSQKIINKLHEISRRIKKPVNQIALNWICSKEPVVAALVGCRNVEQLVSNVQSCTWQLNSGDAEMLNSKEG